MKQIVLIGSLILTVFYLSPTIAAQHLHFPNELKGFQFYGRDRLKDLELKVSNRNQVIELFGRNCEWQYCDYDENWDVMFIFAEDFWRESRVEDDLVYTIGPQPQFLGTLWRIYLRPKKPLSFADTAFSNEFKKGSGIGEHSISFVTYYDANGLFYTLNGDDDDKEKTLRSIEYGLPKKGWRDAFFVIEVTSIISPNP